MLTATIKITATCYDELILALDEVKKGFEKEYACGLDCRQDGITKYDFHVSGEESKTKECKHCGSSIFYEDEISICPECDEEF